MKHILLWRTDESASKKTLLTLFLQMAQKVIKWNDNTYASTDNGTYWQGYTGYPVIGVLILQSKLKVDKDIFHYFSNVNWNSLNKKHKRDYHAALLEVFEEKQIPPQDRETIENLTQQVYEQLKALDLKIVRKIKERRTE